MNIKFSAEVVRYGDQVHLVHVPSGQFCTASASQPAKYLTDMVRFTLGQGSVHSTFRVKPFYKHKMAGDAVSQGEQVVFEARRLLCRRLQLGARGGGARSRRVPRGLISAVDHPWCCGSPASFRPALRKVDKLHDWHMCWGEQAEAIPRTGLKVFEVGEGAAGSSQTDCGRSDT